VLEVLDGNGIRQPLFSPGIHAGDIMLVVKRSSILEGPFMDENDVALGAVLILIG
jgi:hypothetical protein